MDTLLKNREIKFRIWNRNTHKLYFMDLRDWLRQIVHDLDVGQYSVGQYTGFKDKTDTEIYEGDILECPWNLGDRENYYIGYVAFANGSFRLVVGLEKMFPDLTPYMGYTCNDTPVQLFNWVNSKIVGNIFEHPDLYPEFQNPKLLKGGCIIR